MNTIFVPIDQPATMANNSTFSILSGVYTTDSFIYADTLLPAPSYYHPSIQSLRFNEGTHPHLTWELQKCPLWTAINLNGGIHLGVPA